VGNGDTVVRRRGRWLDGFVRVSLGAQGGALARPARTQAEPGDPRADGVPGDPEGGSSLRDVPAGALEGVAELLGLQLGGREIAAP
jgi:hypothetical protein